MLPTPYSPGNLPVYLAGRAAQLELIRTRLARVREFGRAAGPLLAFYGSRGLGKTSLLREAERRAAEAGYLTAWVTGRQDAAMVPEVVYGLAEALRRRPVADRAREVLRQLDRVQVELGVPGAKIGLQASRPADADPGVPASLMLQESLAAAARVARDNDDGAGLVLFVDELQEAPLGDRRSLLIALQHLSGAAGSTPLAVIAAGLPSVHAAVVEAATFGERADFEPLGPLVEVAVAEALRVPAHQHGVRWSDEAVLAVIAATGGYPHHVQLLGDATWEAARPQVRGDVIDVGQVRLGAERATQRMHQLYRSRLTKVPPKQRQFLTAMARTGSEPVSRHAVASALGTTSGSVSSARQQLIDRGLIEPAGPSLLRFTLPGFGQWLRDHDEDLDHDPK